MKGCELANGSLSILHLLTGNNTETQRGAKYSKGQNGYKLKLLNEWSKGREEAKVTLKAQSAEPVLTSEKAQWLWSVNNETDMN